MARRSGNWGTANKHLLWQ